MKLNIKHDINVVCKAILKDQLDAACIPYKSIAVGEIEISDDTSPEQLTGLNVLLQRYGMEIMDDQKNAIIQKTKNVIIEMINREENLPIEKLSSYIAKRVNYSYGYLATLFSEVTYSSIENYIILQKIERAKQMILIEGFTLTEVAHRLNYSSVAHLSSQFKKTTGLTPSAFQAIIKKRREGAVV